MPRIKPMLTAVAVLALMLLAGAGSAAFAGPQSTPPAGVKGPPRGDLGQQSTPPAAAGIKGPPKGQLTPSPQPCTPPAGIKGPPRGQLTPPSTLAQLGPQQPPPRQGIVGGTGVPDCKYPFIVALLDHWKSGSAQDQLFCTGTLIDSDSVLTAAHCVNWLSSRRELPFPPTNLRVVVGRAQLTSNEGPERKVTNIYMPPEGRNPDGFNPTTHHNDIAVLRLESPVKGITPVRLPLSTNNSDEQPGTLLTIAGWGITTPGVHKASDRMQEAQVPVVSDADAEKIYSGQVAFDSSQMMAAGGNGKTACNGDSGGPLFASHDGFYQYGIASFQLTKSGKQVCDAPAGYIEVNAPSIRKFIVSKMGQ